MTSRYKGRPAVTMGRSCRTGGVFPSRGRLGAPITETRPFGSVGFMIEIHELTKRYGPTTAVSDLTFSVRPGTVTGFLGPNGAGKSTTMRVMVGLTVPTSGTATINGEPFAALPNPRREGAAPLDASAQHAGRTGREILTIAADTMGLPRRRVDEMLELVS